MSGLERVAVDGDRTVLIAMSVPRRGADIAQAFAQAAFVPVVAFDRAQLQRFVATAEFDVVVVDEALDADGAAIEAIVDGRGVALLLGDPLRCAARRVHAVFPTDVSPLELVVRADAMLDLHWREESRNTYAWGPLQVDVRKRAVTVGGVPVALTPVQFRIVLALVRAQGAVVTKAELQRAAWPYAPPDDGARLVAHVRRIRSRLEVFERGRGLLVTVRGEGFRLADVDRTRDAERVLDLRAVSAS